jgi:TolB protein
MNCQQRVASVFWAMMMLGIILILKAEVIAFSDEVTAESQTRTTLSGGGWIGFTQLRTNLPGGRAANIATSRAWVVRSDGSDLQELAPQLIDGPDTWTQFAGWSPDGKQAIVNRGWESRENALWEEEHKTFRMRPGDWLFDACLIDISSGTIAVPTAAERVSHYNSGLFFWPNDPSRLGFTALVNGESRPFSMRLDGSEKTDLSRQEGFAYGFHASPDGQRIAYHRDYRVFVANADGSEPREMATGHPFNFAPTWSPDGQWIAFLSGIRSDCHPYLVRRDGSGLRKLASRGGYQGWILFLDVPDYHEGSSDIPSWSADGRFLFYTAKVGDAVELMRVSLDGAVEQLSFSEPGVLHYHPLASPDGTTVLFGSTRDGVRQLWVAQPDGSHARALTTLREGHAAMHGSWQPSQKSPRSGKQGISSDQE